ncbi:hypothetical protein SAMN05660429_01700 [Thalassotalea agarivorans]|uniref:Uncharacterized protein n=2 Tax=Thalassotalea agarivorans TaxID=349064 RepID=A0A1I0E1W7_THASX|nr:hypothetical protein SAMN05660429_01700 [Thalassotalea agarivorans]
MKHTVLLVIALLFGQASTHADEIKKAVTEQGDVVVLMPDGTWYYQDGSVKQPMTIAVNDAPFSKSKDATFLIKSSINNSAVWINPKQWKFKKNNNGHDVAEFVFKMPGKDLNALLINEGLEIPVETLANVAIQNAQQAASEINVFKKEYRTVNGKQVIYMEMEGKIQGIRFMYLGYYFSNESGATQLIAYSGKNKIDEYRNDISTLLNGLTIQ